MKNVRHLIGAAAVTLLFWQAICAFSGWHEALFPSPLAAFLGFVELIKDGVLFEDVAASLVRFAVGYLASVLLALAAGLILGWYSKVWAYLNPIAQVLRPVSPVAWLPFIVLFFGIGEAPAIVIIFLAAFFPVLLATVAAVQKLDPVYLKVAQNFGIKEPAVFTKIILPAIFPQIATGLHLALGTAWVFLVAGEMVGAQSGLGFLIIDARNNLRADLLMAAILTIGLLGLLLDSAMSLAERQLYRAWGIRGGKS
ncbi:ABC transporter permease [Selenomonas sp. CM52]|uniref:ABC transporter permease n=1 Tax=Selenomonas sp. CM52 TaxID=936381 RepID=UPI00027C5789|nr:ABC transporter permease [Selenomonas sp. CM52]EJU27937.1 ABC transporter, permease protein [Selenomonas sp. CM52]